MCTLVHEACTCIFSGIDETMTCIRLKNSRAWSSWVASTEKWYLARLKSTGLSLSKFRSIRLQKPQVSRFHKVPSTASIISNHGTVSIETESLSPYVLFIPLSYLSNTPLQAQTAMAIWGLNTGPSNYILGSPLRRLWYRWKAIRFPWRSRYFCGMALALPHNWKTQGLT